METNSMFYFSNIFFSTNLVYSSKGNWYYNDTIIFLCKTVNITLSFSAQTGHIYFIGAAKAMQKNVCKWAEIKEKLHYQSQTDAILVDNWASKWMMIILSYHINHYCHLKNIFLVTCHTIIILSSGSSCYVRSLYTARCYVVPESQTEKNRTQSVCNKNSPQVLLVIKLLLSSSLSW